MNSNSNTTNLSNKEDLFELAAKAEKLLKEILESNKAPPTIAAQNVQIKQEPSIEHHEEQQVHLPVGNQSSTPVSNNNNIHLHNHNVTINQNFSTNNQFHHPGMVHVQPNYMVRAPILTPIHHNSYGMPVVASSYHPHHHHQQQIGPPHAGFIDASFYAKNPPPPLLQLVHHNQPSSHQYFYQAQQFHPYNGHSIQTSPFQQHHHHHHQHQHQQYRPYISKPAYGYKRKFNNESSSQSSNLSKLQKSSSECSFNPSSSLSSNSKSSNEMDNSKDLLEDGLDDDLNLLRERELKELKCKSVVEKMSVFLKYYKQFKQLYVQRVQSLTESCSDSLKLQFHSLIKHLQDYEQLIADLDYMICEHERSQCKNNHRKTKKFFNKTKSFIRYDLSKKLQANIFEYRRLINSQDRYAGMYDLIETNNYLISLLPDIGISIRRYINRCEKLDEENQYNNNNNNTNINNDEDDDSNNSDMSDNEDNNIEENNSAHIESFSEGVDKLNRYLLKRVDEEESLDELVKERIIKWINKRQSKYILIFSDVDKLLSQHKSESPQCCYSKFHSYLLFNLGKLVTVCDSYHQKLKELLYSTTIRRKKKRKKVKLLPEAMHDVFDEINGLKRSLEMTKLQIKKCNELHKNNQTIQQSNHKFDQMIVNEENEDDEDDEEEEEEEENDQQEENLSEVDGEEMPDENGGDHPAEKEEEEEEAVGGGGLEQPTNQGQH